MSLKFDKRDGKFTVSVLGDFTAYDARQLIDCNPSKLTMMTPYWSGHGLEFLENINNVDELEVVCYEAADLSRMPSVLGVKKLRLCGIPSGRIQLGRYLRLESLSIDLQSRSKLKIAGLPSLGSLKFFEGGGGKKVLDEIACLNNLRYLSLSNGRVENLHFLSRMKYLEVLSLSGFSMLSDIQELSVSPKMKFLRILGSRRISGYNVISTLRKLDMLMLNDCAPIPSLSAVCNADYIRVLSFSGDTDVIDGDISMINKLTKIRYVNFVDRQHYNCSTSDFPRDIDFFTRLGDYYMSAIN